MASRDFQVKYDAGRRRRAKVGFIMVASERTIEDDVMRLRPEGVGVHFTRIKEPGRYHQRDALGTPAAAGGMYGGAHSGCGARCRLLRLHVRLAGNRRGWRLHRKLRKGAPGARPTSLITGVISGLHAVGAKKIVVGTPYLDEINRREKAYLEAAGFDVLDIQGLNIEYDSEIVRVTPSSLKAFACSLDRPDADAIFVSCGALRTLDIVEALEAETGKPVIYSNQAMIWDTLQLAGIADRISGYGRLPAER